MGALSKELDGVTANVDALVADLQKSIAEADAFLADMEKGQAGRAVLISGPSLSNADGPAGRNAPVRWRIVRRVVDVAGAKEVRWHEQLEEPAGARCVRGGGVAAGGIGAQMEHPAGSRGMRQAVLAAGAVAGAAGAATACGRQASRAGPGRGAARRRGGGRGGGGAVVFNAADADKDGSVSRAELKATFDSWFPAWDGGSGALTPEQLDRPVSLPGARGPRRAEPDAKPEDLAAMLAAVPDKAPAPRRARARSSCSRRPQGFVHSSIPLAAKTVEALGTKTKAWTTVITYDPADINAENLQAVRRDLPRQHDRHVPRRSG